MDHYYAHVRRSNHDVAAEDADKAVAGLVIEENDLWVSTLIVGSPGQSRDEAVADPEANSGKVFGTFGGDVCGEVRAGLVTGFHEVEQSDEDTIVLRWSRVSKRNGYKERTYKRVQMQGQSWEEGMAEVPAGGVEEPEEHVHLVYRQDPDEYGNHAAPVVVSAHWTKDGALQRIGSLEPALVPGAGGLPYLSTGPFVVED
ncbi:hypothetical protein ABZT26_36115 [Streptomyces sp. NPDC005395]|uniref:hypothetical protein n=1 Tax=Streptomyces sp. NPDC005395 TaxID=3157042 RepID=UPI0033A94068